LLTYHFDILRLTTRGAARRRRAGFSRRMSMRTNPSQPAWSPWPSGGESARLGDGLTDYPQRGHKRDPVRVEALPRGGLGAISERIA
jgi:hypothetical protein